MWKEKREECVPDLQSGWGFQARLHIRWTLSVEKHVYVYEHRTGLREQKRS